MLDNCPEEDFFTANRSQMMQDADRVRLQDFLSMVSKLSESQKIVTLGQA